jgi:hypothetical protein
MEVAGDAVDQHLRLHVTGQMGTVAVAPVVQDGGVGVVRSVQHLIGELVGRIAEVRRVGEPDTLAAPSVQAEGEGDVDMAAGWGGLDAASEEQCETGDGETVLEVAGCDTHDGTP